MIVSNCKRTRKQTKNEKIENVTLFTVYCKSWDNNNNNNNNNNGNNNNNNNNNTPTFNLYRTQLASQMPHCALQYPQNKTIIHINIWTS